MSKILILYYNNIDATIEFQLSQGWIDLGEGYGPERGSFATRHGFSCSNSEVYMLFSYLNNMMATYQVSGHVSTYQIIIS